MQVSLENLGSLGRKLTVRLPAQRLEDTVRTRLVEMGRTVRLKGFRPGKVPAGVIRQRFGSQIRQEVIQDMVRSSYSEAITQEKLRPVGNPRIEGEPESTEQGVAYTAIFEVYPEFEVAGLDDLAVERPEAEVSDADIDQTVERLRRQHAEWRPVDRAATDGDQVTVDFDGSLDGEALEGGKAERFSIVIGEGRMLPDFEANLRGLAAGADKRFDVVFPDDYYEERLRGRTVAFDIHVHEVAALELPAVDADFIRGFEITSGEMDEFRRRIRENLEQEAAAKAQAEVRRQLIEQLLAANPVEVPAAMVSREVAALQAEAARSVGGADQQADGAYDEVARRRVRVGLILGEIIRRQEIEADQGRIGQKLDDLCRPHEHPDEVRRLYLQNAEWMAQIENSVLEEQVMAWLAERARITGKGVSFSELMGV